LCNVLQGFPSVLNYCRHFAHLVEIIETDSDEATMEVISHTEGLEVLERALLYVKEYSKAMLTDVIFMKHWRDIAASSCQPLLVVQYFIRRKQHILKKKENL
jgi:hypothetical protein